MQTSTAELVPAQSLDVLKKDVEQAFSSFNHRIAELQAYAGNTPLKVIKFAQCGIAASFYAVPTIDTQRQISWSEQVLEYRRQLDAQRNSLTDQHTSNLAALDNNSEIMARVITQLSDLGFPMAVTSALGIYTYLREFCPIDDGYELCLEALNKYDTHLTELRHSKHTVGVKTQPLPAFDIGTPALTTRPPASWPAQAPSPDVETDSSPYFEPHDSLDRATPVHSSRMPQNDAKTAQALEQSEPSPAEGPPAVRPHRVPAQQNSSGPVVQAPMPVSAMPAAVRAAPKYRVQAQQESSSPVVRAPMPVSAMPVAVSPIPQGLPQASKSQAIRQPATTHPAMVKDPAVTSSRVPVWPNATIPPGGTDEPSCFSANSRVDPTFDDVSHTTDLAQSHIEDVARIQPSPHSPAAVPSVFRTMRQGDMASQLPQDLQPQSSLASTQEPPEALAMRRLHAALGRLQKIYGAERPDALKVVEAMCRKHKYAELAAWLSFCHEGRHEYLPRMQAALNRFTPETNQDHAIVSELSLAIELSISEGRNAFLELPFPPSLVHNLVPRSVQNDLREIAPLLVV